MKNQKLLQRKQPYKTETGFVLLREGTVQEVCVCVLFMHTHTHSSQYLISSGNISLWLKTWMSFKCRFTPAWHPSSDTGDQMKGHISSPLTHTIIRLQLAIMLHLMQIDGLVNQHMNGKRRPAARTHSLHTQLTSHTLHKGLPDFPQDGEAESGQMLGDVGIPDFCQQPSPTWHLLHDSGEMRNLLKRFWSLGVLRQVYFT